MRISKETYQELKKLVQEYEQGQSDQSNSPYLETVKIKIRHRYNPNFGDDRICKCGHPYYRHFDSYEKMQPVGCKYCQCFHFEDKLTEERDQKIKELL